MSRLKGFPERGSVLVLALWAVTIASIFSIALAAGAQQRMRVLGRLEERARTRALTDSAIRHLAVVYREAGGPQLRSTKDRKIYLSAFRSGTVTEAAGQVRYEVSPEEKRINLNTARPEVLQALFQNLAHMGEEPAAALAYAIVDYRDEDDFVAQIYGGGSEKEIYKKSGFTEGPKNAPFEALYEVMAVEGMTTEIYNSVRNYITIYGDGLLDINSAESEILIVAGFDPEIVDRIASYREGSDGVEGNADDGVFSDPQNVLGELTEGRPVSDSERDAFVRVLLRQPVKVQSDCYRLSAIGQLGSAQATSRAACVFCVNEDKLRYWSES